ncbi:hypothetical protein [Corynebacterium sp.]|uniref:hypothetical protein n=1 Tax=Corynebacterium sp. TaxID=1720 RepID=UPI003735DB39
MRALSLATVFAALSGFVVIIIAAWALGDDISLTTDFNAYWGLFFAGTGVLTGFMQEITRAVSAARHAEDGRPTATTTLDKRTTAHPLVMAGGVALLIAALIAVTAPAWMHLILSSHQRIGTVLLAVGLASYAVQAAVSGVLSGCQLWRQYAALVAIDSGIRMIIAIVAWLAGWKILAFLVVTVIGAGTWVLIVASSAQVRATLRVAVTDVSPSVFIRQAATAMAASGATAVLITGFPTLVRITNPDTTGQAVTAAAVIYAVTLTRAPLLVPLQQFQSAIIVRFVHKQGRPFTALAAPIALVWVVGVVGAGLAWLIGPWLMEVILRNEAFSVPGAILALLTLGATCTGTLMITGSATIAINKHGFYLSGWVVATVVAVGLLLGPWELATAAGLALIVGPLSGLLIHTVGLLRAPHQEELCPV